MTEASCKALLGVLQPVDPGHDHILDGVGDVDLGDGLREHIAAVALPEGPHLQERFEHLLKEEGVAFSLADDEVAQLWGESDIASMPAASLRLSWSDNVRSPMRVV